ncbi:MAG: hypothetical protein K1X82_02860 [Bacteroidia bacterium]|nr:hypothetical protein [Bacteroidia bacterium]
MKNYRLRQIGLLVSLGAGLFTLNSCYKDYFETDKYTLSSYEPDLAAPIVHSKMTIGDILPEQLGTFLNVANDNFVTLIYSSSNESRAMGEYILFPNQVFNQSLVLSASDANQINGGSSASINALGTATMITNGEQFTAASLTGGTMEVNITSDVPASGTITVTWPLVLKNGNPLTRTITINYTGGLPVVGSASIDMSGYTVDLSPNVSDFNALNYTYTATLAGGSAASAGQSVLVSAAMNNVVYDRISGNLGPKLIDIDPDTTFIQLFNNASLPDLGVFDILEPTLKVSVSHDMVIASQGQVAQLLGYKFNNQPVIFNAPTLTGGPLVVSSSPVLGQMVTSSYTADYTNSTLKNLVEQKAPKLITDLDVTINPTGGAALNEVMATSKFKVDKELQLPLRGLAFNFFVQDTAEFSLGNITESIQEALFRIATINSFPVDGRMQLYFVDESYVIIDSLITNVNDKVIVSAPINNDGKSIGTSTKTVDVLMDETRINRLKDSKNVIIRSYIASANDGAQNVKIYSDNYIDIKLGMRVTLKLEN